MEEKNQLNIELSAEVAKGSYSNLSIITHSVNEFILDFIEMLPGMPKAQVTNRIIITPENAKRLLNALGDNMAKYEGKFGEIKLHNETDIPPIPMGINPSNNKS